MSALNPRRPRRGFTLIELMVASSLSLIVLAAALWSAAELQRRGTFEESLMEAQNTLRAVRELLVVELQRSGMGVGSAEMFFGAVSTVPDVRFSIAVGTQERFDGSHVAFPKDAAFSGPPAAYASRVSDALHVWSWDTSAVDTYGTPIGMISLAECPGGQKSRRVGDDLCLLTAPPANGLQDRLIMVVKPESNISCVMRVKSVKTDAADPRLTIVPGLTDGQAMTSGPCMINPTASADLAFWSDGADIFVFLMRGVSFRVNWKISGTTRLPTLERKDIPSNTKAPAPAWVELSQDVETIRLSLGAVSTTYGTAADPVQWFPDTTVSPARGAIDDCTNVTCKAAIPTDKWPALPSTTEAYEQLMSRVRMVQVQVVTRTPRVDASLIKMNGGNFVLDSDGYPQDGYKRRSSVLEIMPRNFSYSGATP